MIMLYFQDISVRRKKSVYFDSFNLEVPDGVILGLLGEDRKTRTTLLKLAAGSEQPDAGQVLMDGDPVCDKDKGTYQKIGYFPKEYGFYNLLRLEEYYDLFLALYKVGGRHRRKRIEEVLDFLGLSGYREAFIEELPTEILPFVYLGKVILPRPKWLLLDEPFDGMEVTARAEMERQLMALYESGISLVLNTPMYPELMDFITDVAVIKDGKNAVFGPIDVVYREALLEAPVRMHVLAEMERVLWVLRENPQVDRVTVDGDDVIFRFDGGEREEAELLTDLVASGALIHNYMRDRAAVKEIFRR